MSLTNDALLQLLYAKYKLGQDQLGQALAQSRPQLTPALAQQALRDCQAAIGSGNAGAALAASTVASRVYAFIGRREDACKALMDTFNIMFMLAQTEAAYADIHGAIRELLAA